MNTNFDTQLLSCVGASVAIIYNSSKDAPEVAAAIAKEYDQTVKAYQCDVGNSDRVKHVFAQIEKEMGNITGVIANAGISIVKPALELNADDFKKVYDVNVLGRQLSFPCFKMDASLSYPSI